jgi:repressor LexA
MDGLTDKQRIVLETILRVLDQNGVPPTTREIARLMQRDPKSVAQHLDRLEQKGYIRRRPRESRNIRLTEKAQPPRGVPLVGHIAAGQPVLAEENLEGRVRMEDFFGSEGSFFLLRVKGESMKEAGICDGDVVAVDVQEEVRDHDIAVVLLDGEATVKRLCRRKGKFLELKPENPEYETLVVDASQRHVRVIGPVKGLIRRI